MKKFGAKKTYSVLLIVFLVILLAAPFLNSALAQSLSRVELSLSPRVGSFVEGSTFEVPILLDTNGKSINGVEIKINFDRNKLSVVNPSGGVSIIGVWLNPPVYDNARGTASYVGVVPNGITTDSGVIGMITFQAKATGKAVVSISPESKVLLNDGAGTPTVLDLVRAEYNILPKSPEGVGVYSETHPIQSNWYNNNTPVLSWPLDESASGYSFEIDNKPNTVPDNILDSTDTTKTFENLSDGLWYFHIKTQKGGVWSTTGHFLLRIDTLPPAEFTPEVNFLTAASILAGRTLVSFFTTDNLSGVDHYEVGIIDKDQPVTESPVFVQSESPFQVPLRPDSKFQVIVRAVDKAGNVRDESIDVRMPFAAVKFLQDYAVYILLIVIILSLIFSVLHFLFGHHVLRYMHRLKQMREKEEAEIEKKEEEIDKNNFGI